MKPIDPLVSLLVKWRHGRAKIWDYTPTLSRMTLRIESPNLHGNLHLVCGGCRFISGPVNWSDCNLQVEIVADTDGKEMVILRDTTSLFELHCGVVSTEENVEPIYEPNPGRKPM